MRTKLSPASHRDKTAAINKSKHAQSLAKSRTTGFIGRYTCGKRILVWCSTEQRALQVALVFGERNGLTVDSVTKLEHYSLCGCVMHEL